MSQRPFLTILYLSHLRLVRADFSNGAAPKLLELFDQARPDLDDVSLLMEVALSQGPKPGKRIWVLASELWTNTVRLGATSLGLKGDDLSRALAFEAEPLSGISGLDSTVAFQHLETHAGEREFRVAQVRTADLEAMRDAAARAGGKLQGLAHPAGLPTPLSGQGGAWERLELWADAVVVTGQDEGGPIRLQWIGGDPHQGRWRALIAERPSTAVREVLVGRHEHSPLVANEAAPVRLDDNEGLRTWLTAWASYLLKGRDEAPLLKPPARPMATEMRALIAIAAALLIGLGCFAHHTLLVKPTLARTREELKLVQGRISHMEGLEKQTKDKVPQIEKAIKENGELTRSLQSLTMQRQRLAAFLAHFAANKSEHVVIRTIDCEAGDPAIRGWCLEPQQATDMAHGISKFAAGNGWDVQFPTTKAMHALANGGPWEFEIVLRDVMAVDQKAAAPVKGPAEELRPTKTPVVKGGNP